ncbi:UNVERIFIED_CONTAM: hypothetical protein Slati_0035400 [Sesamum latifolium]|uniref:Uncharacterized protein n=1 Tax=Sesamum latifolium TaxID=2727402 RepID=A0AAW2Y6M0_9LAMI
MRSMASSTSPKGIAAIVGVGPKLGRSIARKFAHEGYTVAILARRLSRFADEIAREEKAQVFAIRIDCSESRSIKEAFEGVLSLGFVEVLVYNAHHPPSWSPTSFADIRLDHFDKSLAVAAVGAFHCAQQVLPGMVERGRGTILFTGCSASLNGIPGFSDICCGKFAMRALSQCLASEFQPLGVHVAHVIIDGIIGAPRFITFLYFLLDRVGDYSINFPAKMFFFFFSRGRTARQKRGRVDGPGRGGSDLLASARPGPVGLDSGDRCSPQQQQLPLLK